ncbi:UNKNOWN [Stylonychia lemnae]|uniref:Uncharacterized protein n=1 Tax=Stylonychia lemnae TaxID=5949 RepID=A0A077ZNT4_STYLE|nr:UNKNOWN [Stylonychia lemnae]|eukprot:CDW71578.1 UNKNOWN [Stylonychia lemnae]
MQSFVSNKLKKQSTFSQQSNYQDIDIDTQSEASDSQKGKQVDISFTKKDSISSKKTHSLYSQQKQSSKNGLLKIDKSLQSNPYKRSNDHKFKDDAFISLKQTFSLGLMQKLVYTCLKIWIFQTNKVAKIGTEIEKASKQSSFQTSNLQSQIYQEKDNLNQTKKKLLETSQDSQNQYDFDDNSIRSDYQRYQLETYDEDKNDDNLERIQTMNEIQSVVSQLKHQKTAGKIIISKKLSKARKSLGSKKQSGAINNLKKTPISRRNGSSQNAKDKDNQIVEQRIITLNSRKRSQFNNCMKQDKEDFLIVDESDEEKQNQTNYDNQMEFKVSSDEEIKDLDDDKNINSEDKATEQNKFQDNLIEDSQSIINDQELDVKSENQQQEDSQLKLYQSYHSSSLFQLEQQLETEKFESSNKPSKKKSDKFSSSQSDSAIANIEKTFQQDNDISQYLSSQVEKESWE